MNECNPKKQVIFTEEEWSNQQEATEWAFDHLEYYLANLIATADFAWVKADLENTLKSSYEMRKQALEDSLK